MSRRRVTWTVVASVTAVALVGGGWAAAHAFTSPAQWEAQASAPSPAPVLADVSRGDLVDERILGANVVAESMTTVVLSPVQGAARSIVTESPLAVGDAVAAGAVVARVNGAPVFALAAPFPLYRDLGVGDEGPDVRALQDNLVALGHLGSADGQFGPATARAVTELYRAAGVPAPRRADPTVEPQPQPQPTAESDAAPPDPAAPTTPTTSAYLPLSAVVAVTALPARIMAAPSVGADVTAGATVQFTSDRAVLRLSPSPDLSSALAVGSPTTCAATGDAPVPCTVLRAFEATATAAGVGSGEEKLPWADIAPVDAVVDAARIGQQASVTVLVATLAEDALLVPTTAVAQLDADSGVVLRRSADGSFQEVRVTVVATLKGQTAVTGDLEPGDQVRVG